MRKSNKKGFTVVELVIVIAIIAILAGVLIPTFASLIQKANTSADIQACRQMNTYLAVNEVTADKTIFEVFDTLARGGMTGENYHPLVSDTYYFWDANLNRIMYVDKDYKVIYPEEYKGMTQSNIGADHTWLSLSLDIPQKKPTHYLPPDNNNNTITATATTAEEYAYVVEEYNKAAAGTALHLTVNGVLDMKGSSTIFEEVKGNVTISGTGTGTIKNITSNKFMEKSTSNSSSIEAKYVGGGVIGNITSGTVTLENVTFENINVRGIDCGKVGIVVGNVAGGEVIFNIVTVKNSTVIGQRGVGSLVGQLQGGTCDIAGNVTLDNVKVLTVGGRSGLLVGLNPSGAKFKIKNDAYINITNGTKMGIYENEASQQKIVSKSDLVLHNNKYYASFDTNHSATVTEYNGNYYSTIIQSDTLIYSVKTFKDDGTVQEYSLYGYDENALYLANESAQGTNNGFSAYHTVEELKSNPNIGYDG